MSKPNPMEPVKLFFSIFAKETTLLNDTIEVLSSIYGQPDFVSEIMLFDYTNYYSAEMGENLVRRFLSMEKLIRPEILPDIKLATNEIEDKLVLNLRRQVNIDPGYISKAHLILATGKAYTHRPYLRDGIYADLTLVYQGKKFCSLPWTYPDYADEKQILMLGKIRNRYLLQLKMTQ
ncbi:MAG: hypothetical protein APR62_14240 [Smithella sp. SDB]|nr:MAG: hypothetical protein APR62_08585 [Smithella sp. SDB]KQC09492.1 MAG: hypothetical protein APR62_14240 [Smithella sp. SDB]